MPRSASSSAPPDPVISSCQDWIRLDTEHETLIYRWQRLESQAVQAHNWFRLSDAERQDLPISQEMRDIELRLEPSFKARYELLTRLPDLPAITLQGVCLKLAVATKAVPEDENPEAHALLQSTLKDFQTLLETSNSPQA